MRQKLYSLLVNERQLALIYDLMKAKTSDPLDGLPEVMLDGGLEAGYDTDHAAACITSTIATEYIYADNVFDLEADEAVVPYQIDLTENEDEQG